MAIDQTTVLIWIACGIVTLLIAQGRHATNAATWFVVGLLLGPLGVILAIVGARGPKPVAVQPSKPDPVAALSRLADLKAAGHLTDEEYDAKKRELLARV